MGMSRHLLRALGLAIGWSTVASTVSAQAFDAVRIYGAAGGKDGG